MYLVMMAIFAIGIGALGCAIFMFLVQKEKKKAAIIGSVGLLIIIGAMLSNQLRPAYEDETSILVERAVVTNETNNDGLYTCKVVDVYTTYEYFHESLVKAENFCARFVPGEMYDINYRFKSGTYTILEVK